MGLTLVIMAGGMGSRFGGLKQLEPVGKYGEKIIDYTIYDAVHAGFDKVVFIIRRENLDIFKSEIGDRVSKAVKVEYVFQTFDELPDGFTQIVPRKKPWGTGQAVYCCRKAVTTPFAVVNADDYYGPQAFRIIAAFLKDTKASSDISEYCMAGFMLGNTLTENGSVSRGVCRTDENGILTDITEHTKIFDRGENALSVLPDGSEQVFKKDTPVSMNCWGFSTDFFDLCEESFINFLNDPATDLEKGEFYLPGIVADAMAEKKCRVSVLNTSDRWYGVTYKEDKPTVTAAVKKLCEDGIYPEKLWG